MDERAARLPLRGRCLCGSVRLLFKEAPRWVINCHCDSCRRSSGAAFVTMAGFRKQMADIDGRMKIFESSRGNYRAFCPRCGSRLWYHSSRWPTDLHVCLGLLDAAPLLRPTAEIFTAERLAWIDPSSHARQFTGLPHA